jgi:acyl-CoA synthetase (AMP-forming)/AMP-acid ligase II
MDVRTQMRSAARYNAKREAIVAGDRRLTFDEAWQRGLRLANGLLALGLAPQDRVGVLEDNSLEASDFFLGAAIANLVRVPLYPRNSRESHVHMLGHTGCKAIVVAEKYTAEIATVREELPELANVVVRDAGYEAWLAGQSDVDPDVPIGPEDNYIIRHTGGTTGKSKGVAYTHRAWLAAARDWFYLYPPVEPGDSCLHLAPISRGSGYLFTPMWLGGGRNVMAEKFDPASLLDVMARERIGYKFMVPTILNSINRIPGIEGRRFPDLKCMLMSAAPISDETALKAHEISGEAMYQGYGQTEVLPVAMMGPRQWFAENVQGSLPLRHALAFRPGADLRRGQQVDAARRHGRDRGQGRRSDERLLDQSGSDARAHRRRLGQDRRHRPARRERLSLYARPCRRPGDLRRIQYLIRPNWRM